MSVAGSVVSRVGFDPSASMTYSSRLSSRIDVNKILEPSGDHRGKAPRPPEICHLPSPCSGSTYTRASPAAGDRLEEQRIADLFRVLRHVLRCQLIDARLLTSFDVRAGDEEPARSVEVVHETLLSSWPRLVRWQTQDADAVHVRE